MRPERGVKGESGSRSGRFRYRSGEVGNKEGDRSRKTTSGPVTMRTNSTPSCERCQRRRARSAKGRCLRGKVLSILTRRGSEFWEVQGRSNTQ